MNWQRRAIRQIHLPHWLKVRNNQIPSHRQSAPIRVCTKLPLSSWLLIRCARIVIFSSSSFCDKSLCPNALLHIDSFFSLPSSGNRFTFGLSFYRWLRHHDRGSEKNKKKSAHPINIHRAHIQCICQVRNEHTSCCCSDRHNI